MGNGIKGGRLNLMKITLLQGMDSNHRTLGYEPSEIPTSPPCSIALLEYAKIGNQQGNTKSYERRVTITQHHITTPILGIQAQKKKVLSVKTTPSLL